MNALAARPPRLAATAMATLPVRALCPNCGRLAFLLPPAAEGAGWACPACRGAVEPPAAPDPLAPPSLRESGGSAKG